MTQVTKIAEVYELKKRYYSHQTRSEHTAKIKLVIRQDADGHKKIDLEDEKGRSEFVFIGSDPTRVAAIASLIADAAMEVTDIPWEPGGKE